MEMLRFHFYNLEDDFQAVGSLVNIYWIFIAVLDTQVKACA